MTAAERVAAGAAMLDRAEPGWAQRIDVELLDMASPCHCIAGQLYGRFGENALPDDMWRDCERLGFDISVDCGYIWQDLEDAWRSEIAARRKP